MASPAHVSVPAGPAPAVGLGLRERKKARTRETLVHAAGRLFAERGYEATTVEDIAAAADVSPRTFFRYFPAKDDVVSAIFRSAGLGPLVDARPPAEPAARSLRAMAFLVLRACADNREKSLAVLHMIATRPELRARFAEVQQERIDELAGQVARRLGASPDPLRARLMASWTLATIDVLLLDWAAAGGGPDLLARAEAAFEQLAPALAETTTDGRVNL
ncbi:TetR family transcriptional regulator [Frankia sp. AgPm24]|uniref:TetR family transcriptional regulator n=1 Tax=Frankia sp. AgPm24 TaxID=631128 RepID=UPI0020103927|nr:TetR family transcriptional regulator [Frankia sp. AgPm24]MCK9920533.1 TetR family transcriptional regulator [Frankia sp. AgPm24]